MVREIKRIIKSKVYLVIFMALLIVVITDPIMTHYVCKSQGAFQSTIGENAFQFWLLMNSSGYGHSMYFNTFLVIPILMTGFVYTFERKSSVCEFIITKVGKKKYYIEKGIAVWLVSFGTLIFVMLLNMIIVYCLFGTGSTIGQYYYSVPQKEMFSYWFYNQSPICMIIMYIILNAYIQATLSMIVVGIQMIFKFKSVYSAFLLPFILLDIGEYMIGVVCGKMGCYAYHPLMIVQPKAASNLSMAMTGVDVLRCLLLLMLMAVVAIYLGIKRNEEFI